MKQILHNFTFLILQVICLFVNPKGHSMVTLYRCSLDPPPAEDMILIRLVHYPSNIGNFTGSNFVITWKPIYNVYEGP